MHSHNISSMLVREIDHYDIVVNSNVFVKEMQCSNYNNINIIIKCTYDKHNALEYYNNYVIIDNTTVAVPRVECISEAV